jgi:hypothetical protein
MSSVLVTYALSTLAKVQSFTGESSSTNVTLLEYLINSATDFIEGYCGNRRFVGDYSGTPAALADVTQYYDGNGKKTLQLNRYPVSSITSISYATGDLNSPTWIAYDAKSEYKLKASTGEVYFAAALPFGIQNIKVVLKAGYLPSTIPNDIDLACQKLVGRELNQRKSQGVTQESIAGGSINWNEELPKDIKDVLNRYRIYSF